MFSMQWINVMSCKADWNWGNRSAAHSFLYSVHFDPVERERGVTGGFGFISKPLKRVIFLADLSQICFPKKEMTATSTALGSWARLEEPNYKELNLFIGKHCHSTVIRGKRNPTRQKDSRTPRLRANCQDQRGALPFACLITYIHFPCLSENITYFLHCRFWHNIIQVRNTAPTKLSRAIIIKTNLSTRITVFSVFYLQSTLICWDLMSHIWKNSTRRSHTLTIV